MFKKFLISIMALLMVFMFFACDSTVATTKNTEVQPQATPEIEQPLPNENVFEGENMRFSWEGDMTFSCGKDVTELSDVSALSKDKSISITNVLFKAIDKKAEGLFESTITPDEKVGEISNKTQESAKANSGSGTKDIMTYTFKNQEESGEYETYVAVQIQSFENSNYIASVARIEKPSETKINQVNTILNSVVYDANATKETLVEVDKSDMEQVQLISYLSLQNYMLMEQDIDMLNLMKDFEIKIEQIENSTSKDLTNAENFELMAKREIADYEGNKCEIIVPKETNSNDATYFSSSSNGVSINISPALEKNMEEELARLVAVEEEVYGQNKKQYKDFIIDDIEKTEDAVFQHINCKYVLSSNTTENMDIIDVVKNHGNMLVSYSIRIDEGMLTDKTNILLEEMEKAYGIPLVQYGANEDSLTLSGKAVNKDEELYVYQGVGEEIKKVKGYELLGETVISDENIELNVMVPRGARSQNYGYSASGQMHGVRFENMLMQRYADFDLAQSVEKNVVADTQFWKENPRDYKDIKEIKIDKSNKNAIIAVAGCTKVQYDGGEYEYYIISMGIDLSKEYEENVDKPKIFSEITITVEMADTNSRTQLLYDEILRAYGVDVGEIIENY